MGILYSTCGINISLGTLQSLFPKLLHFRSTNTYRNRKEKGGILLNL